MRNLDSPKEEILKCYHCGNETLMRQVGEHKWGSEKNDEFVFSYCTEMFACPVCHKTTLIEIYSDDTMLDYDHRGVFWATRKTVLYPVNSINSDSVPKIVKEAFEAALKTKGIDKNICLMALRRTLELILKDKGATEWGLKDKIEEIAKKGILPDTLKEASSLAKILGDSAAHGKNQEIDQYDVESMAEFIEFIIEYLYTVPDKINTYKESFKIKANS